LQITFETIKNNPEINLYIQQADASLSAMGFTEHSFAHVTKCAKDASDLLRAYHTAEHTARAKDMPITKDERLREIFAGEWEAMAVDQIIETYPAEFACWRNDIGCSCPPGGEPVAALHRRIVDAVTDIAKKHAGQTVFLFSHATPVRAIATHCLGKTAEAMKELPWVSNASVTRFTYEDGVFTLEEYGHDAFMADMSTNLPANV
jgi:broad specificity phosphatase PhoE